MHTDTYTFPPTRMHMRTRTCAPVHTGRYFAPHEIAAASIQLSAALLNVALPERRDPDAAPLVWHQVLSVRMSSVHTVIALTRTRARAHTHTHTHMHACVYTHTHVRHQVVGVPTGVMGSLVSMLMTHLEALRYRFVCVCVCMHIFMLCTMHVCICMHVCMYDVCVCVCMLACMW